MYGSKKRDHKNVVKNENISSLGQEANTEEPDASEESWSSFSLLFSRYLHGVIRARIKNYTDFNQLSSGSYIECDSIVLPNQIVPCPPPN